MTLLSLLNRPFAEIVSGWLKSRPAGCIYSFAEEDILEYAGILSLRHTPGLGARSIARLLKKYHTAIIAIEHIKEWPCVGIAQKCLNAWNNKAWLKGAQKEWEEAKNSDAALLLWNSPAYPQLLKHIPDAPPLLYYRGDINLFAAPAIALVGSRNPTSHNEGVAAAFGRTLSNCGITIVSGMALGIDRQAHAGALQEIGRSIGVLGTGIDVEYPFSNNDIYALMRRKGLLISEFSPRTAPVGSNFPIRNRIISGLSIAVVVIEAAMRSGSLITARLALEQNREVFAVPGGALDSHSQGCQNLVRQGARAVFCGSDILQDLYELLRPYGIRNSGQAEGQYPEMAIKPAVKPARGVSGQKILSAPLAQNNVSIPPSEEAEAVGKGLLKDADGEKILEILRSSGNMDMDQLAEISGLSQAQLSTAILGLEMLGKIIRLPGARFEATL